MPQLSAIPTTLDLILSKDASGRYLGARAGASPASSAPSEARSAASGDQD